MPTAVISDLHLGALNDADMLRRPGALERLVAALEGADRVVLLGDTLELRERPVAAAARGGAAACSTGSLRRWPASRSRWCRATTTTSSASPGWRRRRLAGRPLGSENEWPVARRRGGRRRPACSPPGCRAARSRSPTRACGWRDGVYATHGQYLDLYLTVPRVESIAASAVAPHQRARRGVRERATTSRRWWRRSTASTRGWPRAPTGAALARGATVSRSVWSRATGNGRVGRLLLGRVTIPAAVAALNRLKVGPFSAELSGEELRRAGLLAMGRVADTLAPDAEHVLFGHTHRAGPLPGDDWAEWSTLSGTRLWNSGNWYLESAFVRGMDERSPYWPGTIVGWSPAGRRGSRTRCAATRAAGTGAGAGAPSA